MPQMEKPVTCRPLKSDEKTNSTVVWSNLHHCPAIIRAVRADGTLLLALYDSTRIAGKAAPGLPMASANVEDVECIPLPCAGLERYARQLRCKLAESRQAAAEALKKAELNLMCYNQHPLEPKPSTRVHRHADHAPQPEHEPPRLPG